MQRVGILINKLQEQLKQGSDVHRMLVTTQMLYTELLQEKETSNDSAPSLVSITSPNIPPFASVQTDDVEVVTELEEQKEWIQDLTPIEIKEPVKEEVIRLEEAKPVVETKDVAATFAFDHPFTEAETSKWTFNPVEVPTLAQQPYVVELKDTLVDDETSLNDRLKENKTELGNILHETPIRDLKKAISINDRHRFIDALFRGDETMYERSIKTINNFSIFAEAEFWIQRELKLKLGWDLNLPEVKLFDQLVKRRFS